MIKRKEKKLEGTDPGDSAVATCLSVHMIYIPFTPKVLIIEARNAKRSEIKITSRKSPGCVLWRERERERPWGNLRDSKVPLGHSRKN